MDFRNGPKRLENLRSLSERSPSHTSTKNVDIPSFTFVHPTILTVQCGGGGVVPLSINVGRN